MERLNDKRFTKCMYGTDVTGRDDRGRPRSKITDPISDI